ncbi:MAG: hypothetical protein J7L89_04005 [Bacteroidales bacterium]|nr:hypothetical protein [Bacteroidales bacterium]
MNPNSDFDPTYRQWIKSEKQESEKIFQSSSFHFHIHSVGSNLKPFLIPAAAILIPLAVISSLILTNRINWFDRKPHYTRAEIENYYHNSVKVLALCAASISQEMDKLQDLKQIPRSFDQLKTLINVRAPRAVPAKINHHEKTTYHLPNSPAPDPDGPESPEQ